MADEVRIANLKLKKMFHNGRHVCRVEEAACPLLGSMSDGPFCLYAVEYPLIEDGYHIPVDYCFFNRFQEGEE